MDVLLPLFQLLYFVVHFLVSLALSLVDTCWLVADYFQRRPVTEWRIQEDAAQLKKTPRHIGLVCVGQRARQVTQVARIVAWAAGFGVRYVSLYDTGGELKRHQSDVMKSLHRTTDQYNFYVASSAFETSDVSDVELETHVSSSDIIHRTTPQASTQNNLASNRPKVAINLLSLRDGREDLARAICQLTGSNTPVTPDEIGQQLVTAGQPDPEVMVSLGGEGGATTFGFPPWQVRLSELHPLGRGEGPSYPAFREVMRRYAGCEQRLGR